MKKSKSSFFDDIVDEGIKQAQLVQNNLDEIKSIFDELEASIQKSLGNDVSLVLETTSGMEIFFDILKNQPQSIDTYNLRGSLKIKRENKSLKICNWRKSKDGYPFVLIDQNSQYECIDKESLISSLGDIFSTGALWLKIKGTLFPLTTEVILDINPSNTDTTKNITDQTSKK